MRPTAPRILLARAGEWEDLTRWERAELGRSLRRLGWTYTEIREVIPVPKATLSGWCAEIELSDRQIADISRRTGSRRGVPRDTQRKRRLEIARIKDAALREVSEMSADPVWVAGTVLYWAEGAKTSNRLSLANSDPNALRLFVSWVRGYLDGEAEFVLKLNLHIDNDEAAARQFWADSLPIDKPDFWKTFIKAEGTGHRKNHLARGVCCVTVRRSADLFHRVSAWIDGLAPLLTSSVGR